MDASEPLRMARRSTRECIAHLLPFLERRDGGGLLDCLARNYTHEELAGLLESDDRDAVKIAAVCLSLIGRMEDTPRLACLLSDEDDSTVAFAEYALWAIWFRAAGPKDAAALRSAVQFIGENRLEEAIERLAVLIDRCPDFAEACNQRAIASFLKGDYRQAIEDCRRALRLNPCHFGAMAGLGHSYAALEQFGAALQAYEAALSIHPRLDGIRQSIACIRECIRKRGASGERRSSVKN